MKKHRVTRWDTQVKDRLETVEAWKKGGLTDEEIAGNLGIAQSTLKSYKALYPALSAALKRGKTDADAQVVNSLFKRACGYEYEEVETTGIKSKDGKEVVARIKKTKKQMAPDVTAQIFYLKNRCSKEWNDRKEISGPDGRPLLTDNVVFYLPEKLPIKGAIESPEAEGAKDGK